jgi:thioredoxin-dependent peroxiredoxin
MDRKAMYKLSYGLFILTAKEADPDRKVIEVYDVWKEKKNYGKVSMGVVRTTYLIDEQGIIIKANDKVKAADDPENMLKELA